MGAWDVFDREYGTNVIILTWSFKLKQYPDGFIKRFNAILCARGYMQLEGIYFFHIYSPVVQCTNISLILILGVIL